MARNIVSFNRKEYINYGDFHTHTIYSMHGMASPEEMVRAAEEYGFKYLAITDHHYPFRKAVNYMDPMYLHRKNQEARVHQYAQYFDDSPVKVIPGYEYNLFISEDITNSFITRPHLRLIGLHTWHCDIYDLTTTELVSEIDTRLSTGMYHIFAHPERELQSITYSKDRNELDIINGRDYRIIRGMANVLRQTIQLCKKYDVAIELNEGSFETELYMEYNGEGTTGNIGRILFWLQEAKEAGVDIIVNTDSHTARGLGRANQSFAMLQDLCFPVDHIINFDKDKIDHYILSKLKGGN